MSRQWFEAMLDDMLTYEAGPGACPTEAQLARYAMTRLEARELDAELAQVARHVGRCPACRQECEGLVETFGSAEAAPLPRPIRPLSRAFLARLTGTDAEAETARQPWLAGVAARFEALAANLQSLQRLRQSVAYTLQEAAGRLLLAVPPLIPAPVAIAVRGDERLYRYAVPELDVTVTLTPRQTATGWTIAGELQPDSADREQLSGVTLKLSRVDVTETPSGEPTQTDEVGCFVFEGLEPGEYAIEIPLTDTRSLEMKRVVIGQEPS